VIQGAKAALAIVPLALSLASPALSDKRPRKPTMDDLATIWIRGASEGQEYFRLELDESGKGLLTVQYVPAKPAVAYTVTSTSLSDYRVEFSTEPMDTEAPRIHLSGEALPGRLDLLMRGQDSDWESTVELRPHEAVMERVRAVTERAQEVARRDGQ